MARQINRGQRSAEISLPAPVGGWNARDALAAMPPTDAVTLDNLFPRPDRVISRGGVTSWATGMTGNVDTLMEWAGPTSRKMLAIASGALYDVSSTGAVGAALASGFSSSQWQHTMFTTPGGQFLVFANGVDAVRNYDGTTVTTPTITGATSTTLTNPNAYRGRLFFIVKNTLKAAYLPINAIAGAAGILDFGQFCKRGGYLVAMGTWTADGGDGGSDDYAVFITSEGEALVYAGTDPSTAGAFTVVGIYQCAKPIGNRPFLKYGADLLMTLEDGLYPISALLKQGVLDPALALSDKIRSAFNDGAAAYGATFGWQILYVPLLQRLIVNVPQDTTGATYYQYVMNSLSRSWCRYTAWNARAWCQYNSLPYYGDANGKVWKAENNVTDNGTAITVSARQAFTDLGSAGAVKHIKMARPRMQTNTVRSNVVLDADVDFQQGPFNSTPPFGLPLAYWNVSLWNVSYWSVGAQSLGDWQTIGAIGTTIAPKFSAQVNAALAWYGTDIVAEAGGIL